MVYFRENPMTMDDLGVPPFMETPISQILRLCVSHGTTIWHGDMISVQIDTFSTFNIISRAAYSAK